MPTQPLSDPTRPSTAQLLDALEGLDHARRYLPASGVVDSYRVRPQPQVVAATVESGCWRFTRRLTFDEALGWTAPAHVDAVGVLATVAGISRLGPDRPDHRPSEDPEDPVEGELLPLDIGNTAVRLVGAVDRDGTVVSRLRSLDGVYDRRPCGGRLLDILLCCLDLPTPPPGCDTKRVLAGMWLGDLLDMYAIRGRKRLSWRDAVAQHPLARRTRPGVLNKLDNEGLAALAAADEPPPPSWGTLRQETVRWHTLAELFPDRDSELAAWMDDGAYARWVLGEIVDPLCTWRWVHGALTPHARTRVGAALSRLLGLGDAGLDVDV